ncbi:MAG: UPF0164 family protein [bacterium]|nr:UPF0164 family protein [bacterium]
MQKILLICFLTTVLFSSLSSKTNSAVFLRINPSARSIGMGGAGNAVFGDVSNIEINPAALFWVKDAQLYFAHNKWFQGISMSYIAYAKPIGNRRELVLAFSVRQLSPGSMDERDTEGIKQGTFDGADTAYTVTLTKKLTSSIAAGITAKTITQELYKESGSAYAADAGVLWSINRAWNLGASIRNAGSDLKVYKTASPLPMTASLGLSYYNHGKYHLGLDMEKEINSEPIYRTGIEYFVSNNFDVRAGYSYTSDSYASDGYTLGLGFSTLYKLFIDYAFVPFGDLGDTHRISLKYIFD